MPILAAAILGGCAGADSDGSAQRIASSPTAPANVVTDTRPLVQVINDYRASMGLAPVEVSPSLTLVAQKHVDDLERNSPAGGSCNLHSWSPHGPWEGCCYTADQSKAQCMLEKPREITQGAYASSGYEIAYSSPDVTTASALDGWKQSSPHLKVILNQDEWRRVQWRAVGAAMSGHYAVVWFAADPDPRAGS
ncbi:MAG TPA: CAP domain-containing protein [Longimicrobiales bacterium]|nr:CAP domain-containing protein [Longimicrobiales bacterium]